jgi:ZIP family zinc transporter
MDYYTLLILGAISGFTIYFGLIISRISILKDSTRYLLSSIATGILIFLIYDVLSNSWGQYVEEAVVYSVHTGSGYGTTALYLALFFTGLSLGVLGLSFYGERMLKATAEQGNESGSSYRFALLIAIGIGTHNFGEGLAIGTSFAAGYIGLATVLVIGFGLHNSTEGFGILGPLIKDRKVPNGRFLLTAGLIGGGPTFLGTVIGSLWSSPSAEILFLSFAAGALIYVTLTMYKAIAPLCTGNRLMVGIFAGVVLGFLTDLIVSIGGA